MANRERNPNIMPRVYAEAESRWNFKTFAVIALVVAAIGGNLYWWLSNRTGESKVIQSYFFDTNSEKLFVGPEDQSLPVVAPSDEGLANKSGVLARVFSCGACGEEGSRFIGWLESYSPADFEKFKAMYASSSLDDLPKLIREDEVNSPLVVRGPEKNSPWVHVSSEEADALFAGIAAKCDGRPAVPCTP